MQKLRKLVEKLELRPNEDSDPRGGVCSIALLRPEVTGCVGNLKRQAGSVTLGSHRCGGGGSRGTNVRGAGIMGVT